MLNTKPDLFKIVPATHSTSSFASGLNSWQQQSNHDSNDRNYDQQFDKREACLSNRTIVKH